MRAAIRFPDQVDGVVTMSAGLDPVPPQAIEMMAALGKTLTDGSEQERRDALAGLQAKVHRPGWVERHPEAAAEEMERMLSHPRGAMRGVTAIPRSYDSIEAQAAQIRCPTLVIWGEHDVRSHWGPRMEETIPDARLLRIPEAGHHVTLDAPDAVTAAIATFLAELRRSAV